MTKWAIWFLLALFCCGVAAETLVVGLPEPGRRPFFWQGQEKQLQGSYVRLCRRIGEIAGVEIEFRFVPQSRLIAEFNSGKIDVEPGVAKEWRPSDNERSRYTQAFMQMNDVLIQRKGLPSPSPASIADLLQQPGLRIGQVRGFYVEKGLNVVLENSELDIARLVNGGLLDVGFMNERVAEYFKATRGFGYFVSAPIASTSVAFRFNRSKEEWVAPFDRAINEMRKSGELKKLLSESNLAADSSQ